MEIFYKVLEAINYVAIVVMSIGIFWQFAFVFFAGIKRKKFPEAKTKRKFAIIIPAHNEESVIAGSVRDLLEKQEYPKDCYDIFVCADNCSDHTASVAKEAGAIVIERFESDPAKKRASYPIKKLMDYVLKEYPGKYDAFIKFDADNHACPTYLSAMNNAIESGVEIGRAFEASTNATQNAWTEVSAAYYIRDSRLACNFREAFRLNSMLSGAGMMVTTKVIEDIGGWDAMSGSDDAEFAINRMLQKRYDKTTGKRIKEYRCRYVQEAIVYEDQPSTFKDTFNRLSRMGHSLHGVFWKKGWKLLPKTFAGKHGGFTYFDMFYNLLFLPIALVAFLWYPAYYIFYIILHCFNAWGPNAGFLSGVHNLFGQAMTSSFSSDAILVNLLPMIAYVLGGLYVIYTFESFLSIYLSKKELGITSLKGWGEAIWLSGLFMVVYEVAIVIGILSKPKWKSIQRNVK